MSWWRMFLLLSACLLAACSEAELRPARDIAPDNVDNIRNYITSGKQDSILAVCRPRYEQALRMGDTTGIRYSGAIMAQAYLFKEETDSLKALLDILGRYEPQAVMPEIEIIIVNVKGLLAIKEGLDYREALKCYHEGLEYARQTGNTNNKITLLTNIVNIYYLMFDRHGLEYAEQAYALSHSLDCTSFSSCMAHVAMAQMLSLDNRNDEALPHMDEAKNVAADCGYRSLLAGICLIRADIHAAMGDRQRAEESFDEAWRNLPNAEHSVTTWFYLKYGIFQQQNGIIDRALELYQAGLMNSYRFNSMEFRKELLERMADIYMGREGYGSRLLDLREHLDSIPAERNMQEFHDLTRRYQQQKYELEIQAERLARADAERRTTRILAVAAVCLVLLISGTVLLVRRNRMYRILVAQHQDCYRQLAARDYVQEQITAAAAGTETGKNENCDLLLFSQIETLMKTKKVFKENDLSLDKLSEYLDSNRNYVSRAINRYAGQSFHNYVNMYRINEAIAVISQAGQDEILLKALSIELGYSSLSVFSKAFAKRTGVAPTIYIRELHKKKSV